MKVGYIQIELFLSLFFIFCGLGLIWTSSKISEYIEPKDYLFELDSSPRLGHLGEHSPIFNNFIFVYNFENKKGNISLEIDLSYYVFDSLQFEIPNLDIITKDDYSVKINSMDVTNKTKIRYWERENIYLNNIIIEDLPKDDDSIISIVFNVDISPSGAFIINNPGGFRFSTYRYGINMVLGSDYYCASPCIPFVENLEEYRLSSSKDVKIDFIEEASGKPIDSFLFKMESINTKNIENRTFNSALGISLLILGIELSIGGYIRGVKKNLHRKPSPERIYKN